MPQAARTGDRRAEIVEAALRLFAARGFDGTGMRDIARAVEINEGTLYHYFPGKSAILEAVLAERGYTVADLPPAARGSLEDILRRTGEGFLKVLKGNPEVTALLLRESVRFPAAPSETGGIFYRFLAARTEKLAEVLAHAAPGLDPAARAFLAQSFLSNLASFWIVQTFIGGRKIPAAELRRHLDALVAFSLAAARQHTGEGNT